MNKQGIVKSIITLFPTERHSAAKFGVNQILTSLPRLMSTGMFRTIITFTFILLFTLESFGQGTFELNLPENPVADRVSITRRIGANQKETWIELDGPGCINHIWMTLKRPSSSISTNRKMVIRIYFDGSEVPQVESPVGDFFGVMHGVGAYPINTPFLSVQDYSGYNSYFKMPFAKSARIEFETSDEKNGIYIQVDWHRYPGQEMKEQRRFFTSWRKENPTQRYGEDFFMLDADGPGQLVGFVYGLRAIDNIDRWSHGGAENIYIDGEGDHPAYIRGIGGEDSFGTSYGGAHHPPETHLYAGMPYYIQEDIGEARLAQRLVGYRFYADPIPFKKSIHMRFGSMSNNICSTVYWYQTGEVRPFVKMPDWDSLLPGKPLKRGAMDLPLPDQGSWWAKVPVAEEGEGLAQALANKLDPQNFLAGDGWEKRPSNHGFIDFNHVERPHKRGVGVHYNNMVSEARCIINSPEATQAEIRLSWDDRAILRVNDEKPIDLGEHRYFRSKSVPIQLQEGKNIVSVTLNNTDGMNHGGWCFAFRCRTEKGQIIFPEAR